MSDDFHPNSMRGLTAELARLRAENERLREAVEALTWYAKRAEGCRKLTREGDEARHALDRDGGKRARDTLARITGET